MIGGLLLAAVLASPAASAPLELKAVVVVEYGPDPPGCGVLYLGRQIRVRTMSGQQIDLVLGCASEGRYDGQPVPAVGSACDVIYEVWDPGRIAVFPIESGPAVERGRLQPPQNVVRTLDCD